MIRPAKRTEVVKEYYFSRKNKELAALNGWRIKAGLKPIISLGIGAPDIMPPEAAIEALCDYAHKTDSHVYQNYKGLPELRGAFASWYSRYYGVELDPATEIQPLAGSKEGILLLALAFIDKGDKVLVPDPGYPTYTSALELVEAEILTYDLLPENNWCPDFEALERMDLSGVKMMWVNYPSMPTGKAASEELYRKIVKFGLEHDILVVNDNPYSFVLTDKPLSILAVPRAKECCIELNSLSKAHNMSGWRIGMVAGAQELISAVLKVKSQMDSGMFKPMQMAAVAALSQGQEWFEQLNAGYRERRKIACEIMDVLGAEYLADGTGLFVWGRVPEDSTLLGKALETAEMAAACSLEISAPEDGVSKTRGELVSDYLLYKTGVFVTPGCIFGHNGRDYIRISLCANAERLKEALGLIRGIVC